MPGTLYIVATPIGNLEDITQRAIRILKEVDLIACEDTRHTQKLLAHYEIRTPTISYHQHNETARADDLVQRLEAGVNVAVVSDAGTPLISDPGYRLVTGAAAAQIPIVPVPGPSSVIAALAGSGMPTDSFYFGGFLPAKRTQRQKALKEMASLESTLVFHEAPHRLMETLEDLLNCLGDRSIVVCRELTKLHEEWVRGSVSQVIALLSSRPSIKGEITLVVGKPLPPGSVQPDRTARSAFETYLQSGLSRMDAIKAVAREQGVSKREIYMQLEKED